MSTCSRYLLATRSRASSGHAYSTHATRWVRAIINWFEPITKAKSQDSQMTRPPSDIHPDRKGVLTALRPCLILTVRATHEKHQSCLAITHKEAQHCLRVKNWPGTSLWCSSWWGWGTGACGFWTRLLSAKRRWWCAGSPCTDSRRTRKARAAKSPPACLLPARWAALAGIGRNIQH